MAEPRHPDFSQIEPLSAAGGARRDEMLESLLPLVEHEGRRRRRRRTGGAAAAAALVLTAGAGAWLALRPAPTPGPQRQTITERPIETTTPTTQDDALAPRGAAIRIVRADTDAVRHLIVRTRVDTASVAIDDDELIDTLAAMGRPTGIVRTQGRTWLTAQVTDAERRSDNEDQSTTSDETGA